MLGLLEPTIPIMFNSCRLPCHVKSIGSWDIRYAEKLHADRREQGYYSRTENFAYLPFLLQKAVMSPSALDPGLPIGRFIYFIQQLSSHIYRVAPPFFSSPFFEQPAKRTIRLGLFENRFNFLSLPSEALAHLFLPPAPWETTL